MASYEQILSEKGNDYERAKLRQDIYEINDKKAHIDILKDRGNNNKFVEKLGHELAKTLLDTDAKNPYLSDKGKLAL